MKRHGLAVLLFVSCGDKEAPVEPCETSADCDTGERCWQEVDAGSGTELGSRCGVCAEQGGIDGTCLQLSP